MNSEESSLDELEKLAESAGYNVVARMEQTRKADSRYQIGAGKVEELAGLVKEKGAEKLIFDNPLKPVQSYNLAKVTKVEAIDRFHLILEIFTKRATTTEAKLQIQLATMKYELAHAREKVRLTKKGEQPGFMGLGAYEADVYSNAIKLQIQTIQRKLVKIREKRLLHRERRQELGFCSISLAGYTSAGKTSLFNALTAENSRVGNKTLFTTLSTTTRLVEFSEQEFLLTDTVGFIDRLPLTLVEAFHSTLEETIYSDSIVLVLDFSESVDAIDKKNRICLETIDRIGGSGIPLVTALNKIDLLSDAEQERKLEYLKEKLKKPVMISALRQTNLDGLKQKILDDLAKLMRAEFTIPMTDKTMKFLSWVHEGSIVKKTDYLNSSVKVVFEADSSFIDGVRKHVEDMNGTLEIRPTKDSGS